MFRPASRLIAFAIKVVKGHDPLGSQGGRRRCLSRERALGVSGTEGLCSILLNLCFIKRKITSGTAGAGLWSRPRLTNFRHSIRHDTLMPPPDVKTRPPSPSFHSNQGRQAAPRQWDGLPLRMLGARIGVFVMCSGSGMISETVRGRASFQVKLQDLSPLFVRYVPTDFSVRMPHAMKSTR